MKSIEILAPAGSKEGVESAIYAGCDAVYVGGSKFGARAYANNLDTKNMMDAIQMVHQYEKKLYMTVNTLLKDHEIEEDLYEMVAPLVENGLDAVIVQDMGVMSYLHQAFPELELHASTQMGIVTGESANLFKEYGVTRYVPARELTIHQIGQCKEASDLELEVFVHGALCYSYSGQCLMSSVVGGRSGNRGMCAGPCRVPYTSKGKTGYFFSPKDVCTLANVPDLVDAGIDSFKIEGRMKKKEYAAFASIAYRSYVDFYQNEGREAFQKQIDNPSSGLHKDIKNLMDLYNRGGFGGGYLFEKSKNSIIYTQKNNHYGVPVGKVSGTSGNTATIALSDTIAYQDILEFRNEDGEPLYEYTVKDPGHVGEKVTTKVLPGSKIKIGQGVFRTRNNQLVGEIQNREPRKVPLEFSFEGEIGNPMRLTVLGAGVSITATGELIELAQKQQVSSQDIEKRLSRMGGTHYMVSRITVDIPSGAFIPLGKVNELRRKAMEQWEEKLCSLQIGVVKNKPKREETQYSITKKKMVSVSTLEQLKAVLEFSWMDQIHIKLGELGKDGFQKAYELLLESSKEIWVSYPEMLDRSFEEGPFSESNLVINSWEMLRQVKEKKNVKKILASNMYVTNEWAYDAFQSWGIEGFHATLDDALQDKKKYGKMGGYITVYGCVPVMVTKGCTKSIRKGCSKEQEQLVVNNSHGDEFVIVNHCESCYNIIYAKEPRQDQGQYGNIRFDFTIESANQVRKVMEQWKM